MENIIFYIIVAIAITIAVCKIKLFNLRLLNGKKSKGKSLVLWGVWLFVALQVIAYVVLQKVNVNLYSYDEFQTFSRYFNSFMSNFNYISFTFIVLGFASVGNSRLENFAFQGLKYEKPEDLYYAKQDENIILTQGSRENKKMQKNWNLVALCLCVLVGVWCLYNAISYISYEINDIYSSNYYGYSHWYSDIFSMLNKIPWVINSVLSTLLFVKAIFVFINCFTKNAITITDKRILGVADGGKKVNMDLYEITSVTDNLGVLKINCGYKSFTFKRIDNVTLIVEKLFENGVKNNEKSENATSNTVDGIQLF